MILPVDHYSTQLFAKFLGCRGSTVRWPTGWRAVGSPHLSNVGVLLCATLPSSKGGGQAHADAKA